MQNSGKRHSCHPNESCTWDIAGFARGIDRYIQIGQSKSISLFSAEFTTPENNPVVAGAALERFRLLELLEPCPEPDVAPAVAIGKDCRFKFRLFNASLFFGKNPRALNT